MPAPNSPAVRRQHLLQQLAALGDLRPGSLVQTYRKCGKPNCACAQSDQHKHGPYWMLTRKVGRTTRTRAIPAAAVEATRAQIAECQRLRQLVAELIEASEQACQAQLEAARNASETTADAQKNSAHSSSSPPSKPNSPAS